MTLFDESSSIPIALERKKTKMLFLAARRGIHIPIESELDFLRFYQDIELNILLEMTKNIKREFPNES